MRSSRLPASSTRYAGWKAERNREAMRDREAVRNRRKLVRSGRTKGFTLGRCNGWPRGHVWDKRRCSYWRTERDRESYSDGNCLGEVSGVNAPVGTSFLYASCGLLLLPPRLLLWCLRAPSPSQNTSLPPVRVRASPPPEHNLQLLDQHPCSSKYQDSRICRRLWLLR